MSIVLVGAWEHDEDFPIYPVGANPKRLLRCPSNSQHPELIGDHRYLFKTAKGWKAGQLWSEFLAYKLSIGAGVHVPRCFVAMDERSGETGALVEFFFGFPQDSPGLRFTHGSDIMESVIVDKKKGRPHCIPLNVRVCKRYGIADCENWWGQVLAFDALIGNTDRHPSNWGLLVRMGENPQCAMAPAFDNGTSLAYEIPEGSIPGLKDERWFSRYLAHGTHHAGWLLRADGPSPHFEMCSKFVGAYPASGAAMRNVILYDESYTCEVLAACTAMQVSNKMTQKRADFLHKLLATRRRELERVLA